MMVPRGQWVTLWSLWETGAACISARRGQLFEYQVQSQDRISSLLSILQTTRKHMDFGHFKVSFRERKGKLNDACRCHPESMS